MRNVPEMPRTRSMKERESDCSTLQSLQTTLRGYVHFQAQLLQLKAVFGNLVLQRGLAKMNESVALKVNSLNCMNQFLTIVMKLNF